MSTSVRFTINQHQLIAPIKAINSDCVCPYCGRSVSFIINSECCIQNDDFSKINEKLNIGIMGICPTCSEISFFTGIIVSPLKNPYALLNFNTILPYRKFVHQFAPEIDEISPQFVKIYEQAKQAEVFHLDELVGMGLRKALEQLIYDYITKILKADPKRNLSDMIKQLNNPKIQAPAVLASWIGNDYTHAANTPTLTATDMDKYIKTIVYFLAYEYTSLMAFQVISNK